MINFADYVLFKEVEDPEPVGGMTPHIKQISQPSQPSQPTRAPKIPRGSKFRILANELINNKNIPIEPEFRPKNMAQAMDWLYAAIMGRDKGRLNALISVIRHYNPAAVRYFEEIQSLVNSVEIDEETLRQIDELGLDIKAVIETFARALYGNVQDISDIFILFKNNIPAFQAAPDSPMYKELQEKFLEIFQSFAEKKQRHDLVSIIDKFLSGEEAKTTGLSPHSRDKVLELLKTIPIDQGRDITKKYLLSNPELIQTLKIFLSGKTKEPGEIDPYEDAYDIVDLFIEIMKEAGVWEMEARRKRKISRRMALGTLIGAGMNISLLIYNVLNVFKNAKDRQEGLEEVEEMRQKEMEKGFRLGRLAGEAGTARIENVNARFSLEPAGEKKVNLIIRLDPDEGTAVPSVSEIYPKVKKLIDKTGLNIAHKRPVWTGGLRKGEDAVIKFMDIPFDVKKKTDFRGLKVVGEGSFPTFTQWLKLYEMSS